MFSVFFKKANIRADFVKLGVEPLASIQEALASISSAAEKNSIVRGNLGLESWWSTESGSLNSVTRLELSAAV